MQWKLGTQHELRYNVTNTSNNKHAKDFEALDKETTLQAVQYSMVCLQELFFLFVSTWISTRTHMKTVVPPWRMPVSHTHFQEDGKKFSGCCWVLASLASSNMYFEEFHLIAGHPFLYLSLLPFVILLVLVPKHPFYIFYLISSKSITKPFFALPYVSVSLQPSKQHFSRALQSRMQVQGLDLQQKKNENYSKVSSF